MIGILLGAGTAAAQGNAYTLDLVAAPASRPSLDSDISINETGIVAFVANDIIDGLSKVFISPACAATPCPSTPISFYSAGRRFGGASINNADPPDVLSEDELLGYYFLRAWQTANPGSFSFLGNTAASGNVFGAFTGVHSFADSGAAVSLAVSKPPDVPELYFYNVPPNASNILPFSTGTFLRPQMGRGTGDVVITVPVGGASEVGVYSATLQKLRFVAGASNAFTNLGTSPGISDDGQAVGFYGLRTGSTPGLYVQAAYPLNTTANPATDYIIGMVVHEGDEGIVSLSANASSRVSVVSRRGTPFLDWDGISHFYQFVTVAFLATMQAGSSTVDGVYTRDLLLEATASSNADASSYAFRVRAKGAILPVVQSGTMVNGTTLVSPFYLAGALASSTAGNATSSNGDLRVPWISFVATSAGQDYAVRGARSCMLPTTPLLTTFKQGVGNWADTTLGNSHSRSISEAGCRLTDISNTLGFFETRIAPNQLNPGTVNKLLLDKSFYISSAGGITFAAGGLRVGPGGFAGGDVMPLGVERLSALLGSRLNNFSQHLSAEQGTQYNFDRDTGVLQGATPTPDPTTNAEALSPVTDFFECNQQPVIVRVANCRGDNPCTVHFVNGISKFVADTTAAPGNVTSSINDPGYANPKPSKLNLLDQFQYTPLQAPPPVDVNRYNRILGVETYSNLPMTGDGNNKFTITAPQNVAMLLTDPDGRQIGSLPGTTSASARSVSTIPNAAHINVSLSDPDGIALVESAIEIRVGSSLDADGVNSGGGANLGKYTLDVVGLETGTYTVQVDDIDAAGNILLDSVTQPTVAGQHDTYTFVRGINSLGKIVPLK